MCIEAWNDTLQRMRGSNNPQLRRASVGGGRWTRRDNAEQIRLTD
jgi:hypothetical protein